MAADGPSGGTIGQALGDRVLRHPAAAVLISLLVTFALAAGLARISFSTDYRVFFDPDGPERQALGRLSELFLPGETVVIALRPEAGSVFTPDVIRATRELQGRFERDPGVHSVESILDLPVREIDDAGFPVFRRAVPVDARIDAGTISALRERALSDPLAAGRLVRADGGALAILMQLDRDAGAGGIREVMARLRGIEGAFRSEHPRIETGMTGTAPINSGFVQSTARDLRLFLPLVTVALVIVMALFLRSFVGVAATLNVVVMAAAGATGLAGWTGVPMTPPLAGAPILVMTIAIAHGIHFLTTFQRRFSEHGDQIEAIRTSYRINFQPILLTSLTTLCGLLSLNFSASPPFRDLGNIVAFGILLAFIHSTVFLPAFLALFPVRSVPPVPRARAGLSWVGRLALGRPRTLVAVVFLAAIGLGALVPRLEIRDQFFEYLDRSLPVRQGTDFVIETLPVSCTMHWIVDGGDRLDPASLRRTDAFASWLRAQPGVTHVVNPADLLRRMNDGEMPRNARHARALIAGFREFAPDPEAVSRVVAADGRAVHVVASFGNVASTDLRRVAVDARPILEDRLPGMTNTEPTGSCYMFATIAETNIRSMLLGTLVAFLLVSLTLLISLRSIRLGLISLAPNLLPPVMAFGVWSLFVGRVGVAASVIAATALGIIVDATIHLLVRYRRARRRGEDVDNAILEMLAGVGAPVWMACVILIAGFAVLSLSGFQITRELGLLSAITIFAAAATDFLLLPPLLKLFDR